MILVTGATGFMGNPLVKELIAQGHNVRAMVIEDDPFLHRLDGLDCEIVFGDITNPESLAKPLEGIKTVFHLAAVMVSHSKELFHRINYEGTKNLVYKSIEAGVEHFIYISAAAANYRIRTDYGNTKIAAEQLMKERSKTNFTVIRPTLLYGPDGGQEFVMYVKFLKKYPLIVLLIGLGRARKRLVWHEDITKGLAKLVNKPITYGKIYNFSGGSDLSMWKTTRMIMNHLKIKKLVVPIPVFLCYGIAGLMKRFMKNPLLTRNYILGVTMNANFSYEDAKKDIGYNPVSFDVGLQDSFPDGICHF